MTAELWIAEIGLGPLRQNVRVTSLRSARLSPDVGLIGGVLLAALGYALPWFAEGDRAWIWAAWKPMLLDELPGWTHFTFVCFAAALIASLWAGEHLPAAGVALGAVVAAAIFAVLVAAAAFAGGEEEDPALSIGLPMLAAGIGVSIVAGVATISSLTAEAAADGIRRRYFPG